MTSTPIAVTSATDADVDAMNGIYNQYIVDSHVSFDTEPWTYEQRSAWLADRISKGYPVLIARDAEKIVGTAWSGPWRDKAAYASSAETTVVVDSDSTGMGIGSLLCAELITRLSDLGFHRCYALVALPNEPSVALHHKLGFTDVGVLDEAGFKDDSFVSTLLLELKL
ncbi:MAG: N-acetyltransferase family protein [Actinomycetota bacterium]